jgi:hypothetical protein
MLRLLQDLFWNVVHVFVCDYCGTEFPTDTVDQLAAAERHTRYCQGSK